jgi:hypothetical protein
VVCLKQVKNRRHQPEDKKNTKRKKADKEKERSRQCGVIDASLVDALACSLSAISTSDQKTKANCRSIHKKITFEHQENRLKTYLDIIAVRLMTSFFAWAIVFFAVLFVHEEKKTARRNWARGVKLIDIDSESKNLSSCFRGGDIFITSINDFVKSKRSRRFDQCLHYR